MSKPCVPHDELSARQRARIFLTFPPVIEAHVKHASEYRRDSRVHASLRRSRELTRACLPKVTHQLVADIVDVDVVRDDRMTICPDLARANLFGKALLDILGYFSAPRRASHASGVDELRANP